MMLARNEYGNVITLPGIHPRKELCEKLGRKHADKVYMTNKNNTNFHIGYVIAGQWWELYVPWKKVDKKSQQIVKPENEIEIPAKQG